MSEQSFRSIRGVLLDASIPVVRVGTDQVTSIHAALDKTKGKESTWSHAQVAVPKDKIDLKTLGFEKTRLAIPLPGESWGTPSYRHGELHAHEAGPFLLIHKDESAPGSGLFAHLTKDVPEALRRRLSGKIAPFVQEKPVETNKIASGEEFAEVLPHIIGLAMGFNSGRQVAGETAAAMAPQGRMGRSENIAKQLAIVGAPAGSILGSALAPQAARHAAKALGGTPTGRSIGQALEMGAPLIGGIGGGMLGGLAVGGMTGAVQHLRGPLHEKEKAAGIWDTLNTPLPNTPKLVAGTPLGEALSNGVKKLMSKGAPAAPAARKTLEEVRAARRAAYKPKVAFDAVALAAMREEYAKIADATFTTSEYAGPMSGGSFQQASQLPAFKAPGLKTAIEKTHQKIAEDSGLATYGKHMALNAGQALRDIKGTFSHPIADHIAPEGGAKRLLSSVALSAPDIASDIYNVAVPPQLTHTKEELKGLEGASAGTWFRRGAGLEKGAAPLRAGKLSPVFTKEKGVFGRAKQLLSGERALVLKTYKERYENRAEHLARKATAHEGKGSPEEYVSSLKRDSELMGRTAGRVGKIHKAEAAKSTAARAGVVGTAAAAGFTAGKHDEKEATAGALTPAGRLVATQRKGTGMGASTTGPSIAEVAKPPHIGQPMPGALKNRI